MKKTGQTSIAQPYKPNNMGSLGKASNMLIVQNNFPLFYYDNEKITSVYLDRMKEWDSHHVEKCIRKYKFNERYLYTELRKEKPARVLEFIKELTKETSIGWTGYRVLGTVGNNGHPYYRFDLFSKDPTMDTETYSGDVAPNVEQ